MLMNEVCKKSGLTKKAVEYYIGQGLINPAILENGYRDFSQDDAERSKKIAILRRLGLSVMDIRRILDDRSGMALHRVSRSKALAVDDLSSRQELILRLAQDGDWASVRAQLEALEKKKTILQKMLDRFPGPYGGYIVYHFAPFLNEPITTDEQQEAFETIVAYLDGVDLIIPEDLQAHIDAAAKSLDKGLLEEVDAALKKAIRDPERYIAENKEILSRYALLKETEAFKQSPAYRLQGSMKSLLEDSGYNDVFIPAMQRLSSTYRGYHEALERADKVFREKMEDRGRKDPA